MEISIVKPNGVFYITKGNKPVVCKTEDFVESDDIKFRYAVGADVADRWRNSFSIYSRIGNLNIRNGVVSMTTPVVFAISKQPVNFHDFAAFFKNLNCKNALHLDGFVSRPIFPSSNGSSGW